MGEMSAVNVCKNLKRCKTRNSLDGCVRSLLTMICTGNTPQERWQDFASLAPRVNSFVDRTTITMDNLNALLFEQTTGAVRKKEVWMNRTLLTFISGEFSPKLGEEND